MDRRQLLGLAGLAAVGGVAAACGAERPPGETTRSKGTRTMRYGEDPSQFAELTLPEGDPKGVVVIIHGGFWFAQYDIEYARPMVPSLVEHGWATWALEYRRVGNGGGGRVTVDDIGAGIDALAKVDGLDLDTVIALGHSAGGHLAALAGSRTDPVVPLTAVVSQAGVLNLRLAAEEGLGGGAVEQFLGHAYTPQDAAFDPIEQVPLDIPLHCVHGDADVNVPINQSETYLAAAKAAGAKAALTRVEGDHFVLIDPSTPAWQAQLEILDSLA